MIWYLYSQLHKINFVIPQRMAHHVEDSRNHFAQLVVLKKLIDLSYPVVDHVYSDCLYIIIDVD
jgi:hypothetical protein